MVWWKTFVELIQTNCADVGFKPFFALFEEVDKVLIGNHDCKAFIVIHLLEYIFLLSTKGDYEYPLIYNVIIIRIMFYTLYIYFIYFFRKQI